MATQAKIVTDRDSVVGVFHSDAEAQKAVRDLKAAGFTFDQIGVASRDHEGVHDHEGTHQETPAAGSATGEAAVAGAATGVGVGALWGLGIVAGVVPAIGPAIAGGALAAIVASAAGTGVAGGLVGLLVGLGIPEEEAKFYHRELEQGRTIVTVKATGDQAREAIAIMDRSNAYDYHRRESDYATNPKAERRVNAEGEAVPREDVVVVDPNPERQL